MSSKGHLLIIFDVDLVLINVETGLHPFAKDSQYLAAKKELKDPDEIEKIVPHCKELKKLFAELRRAKAPVTVSVFTNNENRLRGEIALTAIEIEEETNEEEKYRSVTYLLSDEETRETMSVEADFQQFKSQISQEISDWPANCLFNLPAKLRKLSKALNFDLEEAAALWIKNSEHEIAKNLHAVILILDWIVDHPGEPLSDLLAVDDRVENLTVLEKLPSYFELLVPRLRSDNEQIRRQLQNLKNIRVKTVYAQSESAEAPITKTKQTNAYGQEIHDVDYFAEFEYQVHRILANIRGEKLPQITIIPHLLTLRDKEAQLREQKANEVVLRQQTQKRFKLERKCYLVLTNQLIELKAKNEIQTAKKLIDSFIEQYPHSGYCIGVCLLYLELSEFKKTNELLGKYFTDAQRIYELDQSNVMDMIEQIDFLEEVHGNILKKIKPRATGEDGFLPQCAEKIKQFLEFARKIREQVGFVDESDENDPELQAALELSRQSALANGVSASAETKSVPKTVESCNDLPKSPVTAIIPQIQAEAKKQKIVDTLLEEIRILAADTSLTAISSKSKVNELVSELIKSSGFNNSLKRSLNFKKLFDICLGRLDIIYERLALYLESNPNKNDLDELCGQINERYKFGSPNGLHVNICDQIKIHLKNREEKAGRVGNLENNNLSLSPLASQEAEAKISKNQQPVLTVTPKKAEKSTEDKDQAIKIEAIKTQLEIAKDLAESGNYSECLNYLKTALNEINVNNLGFNYLLRARVKDCFLATKITKRQDDELFRKLLLDLPSGMSSVFLAYADLFPEKQQQNVVNNLIKDMETAVQEEKSEKIGLIFEKLMFLKQVQVVFNNNQGFRGAIQCHDILKTWFKEKNHLFLKVQDLFFNFFKKQIPDNEVIDVFKLHAACLGCYFDNFSSREEFNYIRNQIRAAVSNNAKNHEIVSYGEEMWVKLHAREPGLPQSEEYNSHSSKNPNQENELSPTQEVVLTNLGLAMLGEYKVESVIDEFINESPKTKKFVANFLSFFEPNFRHDPKKIKEILSRIKDRSLIPKEYLEKYPPADAVIPAVTESKQPGSSSLDVKDSDVKHQPITTGRLPAQGLENKSSPKDQGHTLVLWNFALVLTTEQLENKKYFFETKTKFFKAMDSDKTDEIDKVVPHHAKLKAKIAQLKGKPVAFGVITDSDNRLGGELALKSLGVEAEEKYGYRVVTYKLSDDDTRAAMSTTDGIAKLKSANSDWQANSFFDLPTKLEKLKKVNFNLDDVIKAWGSGGVGITRSLHVIIQILDWIIDYPDKILSNIVLVDHADYHITSYKKLSQSNPQGNSFLSRVTSMLGSDDAQIQKQLKNLGNLKIEIVHTKKKPTKQKNDFGQDIFEVDYFPEFERQIDKILGINMRENIQTPKLHIVMEQNTLKLLNDLGRLKSFESLISKNGLPSLQSVYDNLAEGDVVIAMAVCTTGIATYSFGEAKNEWLVDKFRQCKDICATAEEYQTANAFDDAKPVLLEMVFNIINESHSLGSSSASRIDALFPPKQNLLGVATLSGATPADPTESKISNRGSNVDVRDSNVTDLLITISKSKVVKLSDTLLELEGYQKNIDDLDALAEWGGDDSAWIREDAKFDQALKGLCHSPEFNSNKRVVCRELFNTCVKINRLRVIAEHVPSYLDCLNASNDADVKEVLSLHKKLVSITENNDERRKFINPVLQLLLNFKDRNLSLTKRTSQLNLGGGAIKNDAEGSKVSTVETEVSEEQAQMEDPQLDEAQLAEALRLSLALSGSNPEASATPTEPQPEVFPPPSGVTMSTLASLATGTTGSVDAQALGADKIVVIPVVPLPSAAESSQAPQNR